MEYPSINIQGNIISGEILDRIRSEDIKFQQNADFGLDRKTTVRDEIGIAWAAARAHWTAFKLRIDRLKAGETGAAETRNSWMIPLLRELGYDVEKSPAFVHPDTQKTYAISHRAANLNGFPIHIMGYHDDLNQRRETSGPRLSPHALTQEYLNITEHVYALVSNGRFLRLLRDATRLVRLSYLEVDLEKMMEGELYSDFAILFRLMHATRMPKDPEQNEESYIEYYHQESLASGSRIREKLSNAVKKSIKELANGFLRHKDNEELRLSVMNSLSPDEFYLYQLRLIYRLLFLIVTEERNLVFTPPSPPKSGGSDLSQLRKIYYENYSIERLRKLALRLNFVDGRKHDLWEGLKTTFLLFENGTYGEKLGIKPLGSGLFSPDALGVLMNYKLSNASLLKVIRHLTLFENDQHQLVRVNYSDLDVEEFGSVYEGLLEYNAGFTESEGQPRFIFIKGSERSKTGSHYTPEELVKPLIKHSLDYIIEERLKQPDKENSLLSIRVCDVACGSGHILLSAARRIAVEVATVRTREDQPSPEAIRIAIKDVIRSCIYGVDKNPLAVELCKVALWLESHNPGEPLGFLDHHIKCGDSIVGLAHIDELKNGIPNEAFKALPGDDKEIASAFLKRNRKERETPEQLPLDFDEQLGKRVKSVLTAFDEFARLPEKTPGEISIKEKAYRALTSGSNWYNLRILADMAIAPFFILKTAANEKLIATDGVYREYLRGAQMIGQIPAKAQAVGVEKRFFHWFLEFPEIFANGGFDCILGNPPFLKGAGISGTFGFNYLNFITNYFSPLGGQADLVTYFFRRNFSIIKNNGFISLISTNTISQGDSRKGSLDVINQENGRINFAIKSMRWPGKAAVEVSLISIYKGKWTRKYVLGNTLTNNISTYLDDSDSSESVKILLVNQEISFRGVMISGMGFLLDNKNDREIIQNPEYLQVVRPYFNGDDINSSPNQKSDRHIIQFYDWPLKRINISEWKALSKEDKKIVIKQGIYAPPTYELPVASDFPSLLKIIEENVKPERERSKESHTKEHWWLFGRTGSGLRNATENISFVFVSTRITKHLAFSRFNKNNVFADLCVIFSKENYHFFALIQNSIHESWAWKYSSTLGSGTLNYSNTNCFETFPFPQNLDDGFKDSLEIIGKSYYDYRKKIMQIYQLGLTKTYNLFHSKELQVLTADENHLEDRLFERRLGKNALFLRKHLLKTPGTLSFNEAVAGIIKLRELHVEMDNAVQEAYGWSDIELRHDFYEVDYLPENDRVRYTIHPDARKEILKRLLELNHKIHEEEVKAGLWDKKGSTKKGKKSISINGSAEEPEGGYGGLFDLNT